MAFSSQRPFHPGQPCVCEGLIASPFQPQEERRGGKQTLVCSKAGFSIRSPGFSSFSLCLCIWTMDSHIVAPPSWAGQEPKARVCGGLSFSITWDFFKKRTIDQRLSLVLVHAKFWDGLTLPVQNQLIADQLQFPLSVSHSTFTSHFSLLRGNI